MCVFACVLLFVFDHANNKKNAKDHHMLIDWRVNLRNFSSLAKQIEDYNQELNKSHIQHFHCTHSGPVPFSCACLESNESEWRQ